MSAALTPRSSPCPRTTRGQPPSRISATFHRTRRPKSVISSTSTRRPAKPASLRAAVGRKLTAAGAIYLPSACAVVPLSGPAECAMRRMRATISSAGGSAVLLAGSALAGAPELTGEFNAQCDRGHQDIIGGCRDAVADLEALTAAGEFHYQQLLRLARSRAALLRSGRRHSAGAISHEGRIRRAPSPMSCTIRRPIWPTGG